MKNKVVFDIKNNPYLGARGSFTYEKVYDVFSYSPSSKYCVMNDIGYAIWEDADKFITFKEYRKRKLEKLNTI
jgi:hypothetical protein